MSNVTWQPLVPRDLELTDSLEMFYKDKWIRQMHIQPCKRLSVWRMCLENRNVQRRIRRGQAFWYPPEPLQIPVTLTLSVDDHRLLKEGALLDLSGSTLITFPATFLELKNLYENVFGIYGCVTPDGGPEGVQ